MAADVILNGETLELQGYVIATENEVTSKGKIAGFAFHDRTDQKNRYVLYADKDKVRLWKDKVGDVLTINENTQLTIPGVVTKQIITDSLVIKYQEVLISPGSFFPGSRGKTMTREMDLLQTIKSLQDRIEKLEAANGKPGGIPENKITTGTVAKPIDQTQTVPVKNPFDSKK